MPRQFWFYYDSAILFRKKRERGGGEAAADVVGKQRGPRCPCGPLDGHGPERLICDLIGWGRGVVAGPVGGSSGEVRDANWTWLTSLSLSRSTPFSLVSLFLTENPNQKDISSGLTKKRGVLIWKLPSLSYKLQPKASNNLQILNVFAFCLEIIPLFIYLFAIIC